MRLTTIVILVVLVCGCNHPNIQNHQPGTAFAGYTGEMIYNGIKNSGWAIQTTEFGMRCGRCMGQVRVPKQSSEATTDGFVLAEDTPDAELLFRFPDWVQREADRLGGNPVAIMVVDSQNQLLLAGVAPMGRRVEREFLKSWVKYDKRPVAEFLQQNILDQITKYVVYKPPP